MGQVLAVNWYGREGSEGLDRRYSAADGMKKGRVAKQQLYLHWVHRTLSQSDVLSALMRDA
jgi:hypothetical protein